LGDIVRFEVDRQLTAKVRELESAVNVTPYMILLAVFNILLSKYSEQEDIVVGSSISGRSHPDLQKVMGMLVNMLSMRNRPSSAKTFLEFLEEVKENTLSAIENQDYQFDRLIARLGLQGGDSRNPLFNVVFSMQNMGDEDIFGNFSGVGGQLKIYPYEYDDRQSKFDLLLVANESDGKIHFYLEYSTELFSRQTAEKTTRSYLEILEQILENQNIMLKDISISHGLTAVKMSVLDNDEEFEF
jgi:non-ribosomal peptide synthetase component F